MSDSTRSICRYCKTPLEYLFVDLGMSPLCQTQIQPDQLNTMEAFYPLRVHVCHACFLVQLDEYVSPDQIFSANYPYFSSFSDSWIAHCKAYCEQMQRELELNQNSLVMEVASNDGYLLQHFVAKSIPVLGIEPAANVAEVAIKKGVPTEIVFLGEKSARKLVDDYGQADLVLGNNVLAHVPDINDFVKGLKILLKPGGSVTIEFPHLMKLMQLNQFDTIYHEHFSYLSWFSVKQIFAAQGLSLFDVEELPTHGGSLRIYARHTNDPNAVMTDRASQLEQRELEWGVNDRATYENFAEQVKKIKRDLLQFLIEQKNAGKTIVGYGAPGKGNTLLNYCGIRTEFLDYTVDRNPHKQNTFTPGTRIPILDPSEIEATRPDYVLILPWNLRTELVTQLAFIKEWGGRLVVPIPQLEVLE